MRENVEMRSFNFSVNIEGIKSIEVRKVGRLIAATLGLRHLLASAPRNTSRQQ